MNALDEAVAFILARKEEAAALLLASSGDGGFSREEIVEVLNDPSVKFTTTPENVLKYAEFMHSIGSIRNRPASWKDMFFSDIHDSPGS
jgi:NitT/TauT family transport system substrate-binding protein